MLDDLKMVGVFLVFLILTIAYVKLCRRVRDLKCESNNTNQVFCYSKMCPFAVVDQGQFRCSKNSISITDGQCDYFNTVTARANKE